MERWQEILEEDVLRLYREPIVGANYTNSYGEENLVNLIGKYRSLDSEGMAFMRKMIVAFSQSEDLSSSYVSVGVLHALGMDEEVENAYRWARARDDAQMFTNHFDIGKSLAGHFAPPTS